MEQELVARLIEFVESASPTIWAAAQRQVGVSIAQGIYVGGIAWVLMLISVFACSYYKRRRDLEDPFEMKSDWSDFDGKMWISLVIALVLGGLLLISISAVIGPIMNPDYYAIKALKGLIR